MDITYRDSGIVSCFANILRNEIESELDWDEGKPVKTLDLKEEEIVVDDDDMFPQDGFDLRNANLLNAMIDGAWLGLSVLIWEERTLRMPRLMDVTWFVQASERLTCPARLFRGPTSDSQTSLAPT